MPTASRDGPSASLSMPATRRHRGTDDGHRPFACSDTDVASDVDDIQKLLRPRRAGAGIPPPPARPARRLRPASPRGPAPRGSSRDARHPGRDGAITSALRNPGASRRIRGRRGRRQISEKDAWHERPSGSSSASPPNGWTTVPTRRRRAVIDAVLLAVRSTPQERDFRVPWRTLLHEESALCGGDDCCRGDRRRRRVLRPWPRSSTSGRRYRPRRPHHKSRR